MLRRKLKRTREEVDGIGHSKKSKKNDPETLKLHQDVEQDESEEAALEELVFGRGESLLNSLSQESTGEEIGKSSLLFTLDTKGSSQADKNERRAAWQDEDDEKLGIDVVADTRLKKLRVTEDESILRGTNLQSRLKTQFEKVYGAPSWADLDTRKGSDDEDDILQKAGNLLSKTSLNLAQGLLEVSRVKDANCSKPSSATIQSLEFHPSAKVLLTAGMNKTLDLFQIDGEKNSKIQSVFIKDFPIHTAHFSADGEQVIMSSRRSHFYVYDMIAGQVKRIPSIRGRSEKSFERFQVSPDQKLLAFQGSNGYIVLVSSKTKQWVGNLKMSGPVRSMAFSSDGSKLYSSGGDGEVYIWNMNTRSCMYKFHDDGCLEGTSLAASPDGQFLACGSDSGVVNIYDSQGLNTSYPKPLKAVMNLTTAVTKTLFNPTSEILCMYSRATKDSLKLVHLPSLTVFSNWPTQRTPLGYVHSMDFSPRSGYMAVGNDKGKALLYRLNHFTDS